MQEIDKRAKDILKEYDNLIGEFKLAGLPEEAAREKAIEFQKEKYKSNSFSDKVNLSSES